MSDDTSKNKDYMRTSSRIEIGTNAHAVWRLMDSKSSREKALAFMLNKMIEEAEKSDILHMFFSKEVISKFQEKKTPLEIMKDVEKGKNNDESKKEKRKKLLETESSTGDISGKKEEKKEEGEEGKSKIFGRNTDKFSDNID